MSKQSLETFRNRVENVIDIHRKAEDLTNAEVIGVIEMIKLDLHAEILDESEEESGKEWKDE